MLFSKRLKELIRMYVKIFKIDKNIKILSVKRRPILIIFADKIHLAKNPVVGGKLPKLHKNSKETKDGPVIPLLIKE